MGVWHHSTTSWTGGRALGTPRAPGDSHSLGGCGAAGLTTLPHPQVQMVDTSSPSPLGEDEEDAVRPAIAAHTTLIRSACLGAYRLSLLHPVPAACLPLLLQQAFPPPQGGFPISNPDCPIRVPN